VGCSSAQWLQSTAAWPAQVRVWLILALLLPAAAARAAVKLPAIFGDHMVLQEQATLPVWGWAEPGERIAVAFGGQKAEGITASDGEWRVDLPALPAGTPPGTLTISGKSTVTLRDVLAGEVWLCSGQSNMELPLTKTVDSNRVVSEARDDQLRLCQIPWDMAIAPRDDVRLATGDLWHVCTPETAQTFSAVGYFFGKKLQSDLRRPVGLIESCWGGTPCQAWTDLKTLQLNPSLQHYVQIFDKFASGFPGGDAQFAQRLSAEIKPGERPGASLVRRGYGPHLPTSLFNAMIHPLIPFAIKGVIWYQGEDNADNEGKGSGMEYRTLFPAMITDWRGLWKEGDFPFLFVQLANLADRPKAHWAIVRESQFNTLSLPNTGMAVTIDIGAAHNIHPTDKADVGDRLSLLARHIAYGEDVVCTGPLYNSMAAGGDKIRISFKPESLGGGLVIGKSPWIDPKAAPASTTKLVGFTIAGEDQQWVEARATIDGETVVVSSPRVSKPIAVRYAWGDSPACNLYNKGGLPASPFRTDTWPEPPAAAEK
jgi:sialate O-acetylesterase